MKKKLIAALVPLFLLLCFRGSAARPHKEHDGKEKGRATEKEEKR